MSSSEPIEINEYVKVYIADRDLPVDQVLDMIKQETLALSEEQTNVGMVEDNNYWISFSLSNSTQEIRKYLEVLNPQLDYLALYEVGNGIGKELYITGDQFVFDQRPVRNRNFILPIKIQKDSVKTYLLNVDKKFSSVKFPMVLYDSSYYPQKISTESISFGLYFGILFLVTFISLVVGVILKQRVFVIYGVYVLAFAMWFFSRAGFSYQFITSNYPNLNTHFYPFFTSLVSMLLIVYVKSFFKTSNLIPRFDKFMSGMVIFFLVGFCVWGLFPESYLAYAPELFAVRYFILVTTIVFAYTSAIKSLKNFPIRAKLFLLGYSLFFLGVLSELANQYGLVDLYVYFIPPIMFGYLIEVVALSIAMGSIILSALKQRDELAISNKVLKKALASIEKETNLEADSFITLKSKAVLNPDDIRYIQSDDHYIEFYLIDKDNPEVDRNSISYIRKILPSQFSQIHRSTIVNLKYVKSIFSDKVQLRGGEELRLSRTYKKEIEKKLKG